MGCLSSKESAVDLAKQTRLMRLAQSEGHFCDFNAARAVVIGNPGRTAEELLPLLLRDGSTRPIRVARSRDPRTLSPAELIQAAREARLPITAARAGSGSSAEPSPLPIPVEYLDEVSPVILFSDVPDGLRDTQRSEVCAICCSRLLTDDASVEDALALRQLPCAHCFHAACIDPWLTGAEASCPSCRASLPRPPSEAAAAEARSSAYGRWTEAQKQGVHEVIRRHSQARADEWRRRDEEDRERARRAGQGVFVPA